MSARGSVLLQVLVAAAVAGLICASIMRVRLQPAMTAANSIQGVENDAAAQAALNRVSQVWMAGGSCSSSAPAGVACGGSGCSCSCRVTDPATGAALATVTAAPSGGACSLTVASP